MRSMCNARRQSRHPLRHRNEPSKALYFNTYSLNSLNTTHSSPQITESLHHPISLYSTPTASKSLIQSECTANANTHDNLWAFHSPSFSLFSFTTTAMIIWIPIWFTIVILVTTLNKTLFTSLKCPFPITITMVSILTRRLPSDPYDLLCHLFNHHEVRHPSFFQLPSLEAIGMEEHAFSECGFYREHRSLQLLSQVQLACFGSGSDPFLLSSLADVPLRNAGVHLRP